MQEINSINNCFVPIQNEVQVVSQVSCQGVDEEKQEPALYLAIEVNDECEKAICQFLCEQKKGSASVKSMADLLVEYSSNPKGWPGLHYAIEQKRVDVAKEFMKCYPEQIHMLTPNIPYNWVAPEASWEESLKILVLTNYDPGYSALELATKSGLIEIAELLLQQGVKPTISRRETICDRGELKGVRAIWHEPWLADYQVYTPLYWAVMNGDIAMYDLLVAHGADPDRVYTHNWKTLEKWNWKRNEVNKSALQLALEQI